MRRAKGRELMPIIRIGLDADHAIDRFSNAVRQRLPGARRAAARVLVAEWRSILLTPGRGRMYGTHQASAPGDPPAPETGALQRSIVEEDVSETTTQVGVSSAEGADEYALLLEFGTLPRGGKPSKPVGRGRLGSRLGGIAPRPHARPAFTRAQPKMLQAILSHLRSPGTE